MSTDCKVRIYKINVRPVLTCIRNKSRNIYPTTAPNYRVEDNKGYHGKTLIDKIRSDQLRRLSGIQDIIKWANVRREWD